MQEKIKSLMEENKKLKKNSTKSASDASVISSETFKVEDWKLIVEQVNIDDTKDLRSLVDVKKNTNEKLCVVILTESSKKVAMVCGVTKNLVETLSAKEVIVLLSEQINGTGGGLSLIHI